ncbi:helix-turn-helix domain-containing protein [Streptomyces noursei]|uniref:MmyB family transcriptional regulator n=1 Tax=Streptomyces noursei TaxID=1971 RepID=UPI0037F1D51A
MPGASKDVSPAFLELCRRKREVLSPAAIGVRDLGTRPGPSPKGVAQWQVDVAMGTGHDTYRRIESGKYRPSQEMLRRLATALQFKESEFAWAHWELYGSNPTHSLFPETHLSIPRAYKTKVEAQSNPSYVQNFRWEPQYVNDPFRAVFPSGHVPENLALWWLTSDEARDPEHGVLIHWERLWAPLLVAQFRASLAGRPDDPVLQEIDAAARRDPLLKRIYARGESPYIHPDGDRRPLRYRGVPGSALLLFSDLRSTPGATELTFIFEPDESVLAA